MKDSNRELLGQMLHRLCKKKKIDENVNLIKNMKNMLNKNMHAESVGIELLSSILNRSVFHTASEVIFHVKNRHGRHYKYKFTSWQQPACRLL